MATFRVRNFTVIAGSALVIGFVGSAIGAPANAAITPKLCTVKGKVVDIATTLDSLTTGTLYVRNCTGRTIKNVVIDELSRYPSGPTCPLSIGGQFGSGDATPHEFDRVPFATGLTPSCHGRYTHSFEAVHGKTVLDRAKATFVVK